MSKRIDVENLDVFYGDFRAVEGVNIDIDPNTVTAFIGPSGCGKSTFLRTLNRMHEVIPGARVEGGFAPDNTHAMPCVASSNWRCNAPCSSSVAPILNHVST